MTQFKTEQENFWAGGFGDEYNDRNNSEQIMACNLSIFKDIFKDIPEGELKSLIEFGANIGLNLVAIKKLRPAIEMSAVEINAKAVEQLKINVSDVEVHNQSILDFKPSQTSDLALIKGVLIHINPEMLNQVYEILYQASHKYICVVEYYDSIPTAVNYRGYSDKLFKRDFAGEILDKFPDLELVDYGFKYHRDPDHQDDVNWFLLKKC
jgi:pseudaminic acid biosynthesis-associated methylase